jgi:uncharacterized protein (TIGR03000 family)
MPTLPAWTVVAVLALVASPAGETRQARPQTRSAHLTVSVPHPETILSLNGRAIIGNGPTRELEVPDIGPRDPQRVTLTASWQPNTYTTMTRTTEVSVRAGERLAVDMTRDSPGDRVRVIYVPTPNDVAAEMVRLAAVVPGDVIFEPGCGDARITIAAIKAGAARAICVDLDPDRAAESRANVERAGLADRIDVRQGDALDVKDLADVTVVLLYMGDHFNQLIRPVLWKSLRPGARIVSHRFLMGDWQPDKTVSMQSDDGGGTYDVHLWTITEEVKRRWTP